MQKANHFRMRTSTMSYPATNLLWLMIIGTVVLIELIECRSSSVSEDSSAFQREAHARVKRSNYRSSEYSVIRLVGGALFQVILCACCFICIRRWCARRHQQQGRILIAAPQRINGPNGPFPYPPSTIHTPYPGSVPASYPNQQFVSGVGGGVGVGGMMPAAPPSYNDAQLDSHKYEIPPPSYDEAIVVASPDEPNNTNNRTTGESIVQNREYTSPSTTANTDSSPTTNNNKNNHQAGMIDGVGAEMIRESSSNPGRTDSPPSSSSSAVPFPPTPSAANDVPSSPPAPTQPVPTSPTTDDQ